MDKKCWDIKLVCSMTVRSFWTSSRGREAQARKSSCCIKNPAWHVPTQGARQNNQLFSQLKNNPCTVRVCFFVGGPPIVKTQLHILVGWIWWQRRAGGIAEEGTPSAATIGAKIWLSDWRHSSLPPDSGIKAHCRSILPQCQKMFYMQEAVTEEEPELFLWNNVWASLL